MIFQYPVLRVSDPACDDDPHHVVVRCEEEDSDHDRGQEHHAAICQDYHSLPAGW